MIDDDYLDIIDKRLVGTLGIGSRRSEFFIRIYTKHRNFVRWETELKRKKAQKLSDILVDLVNNNIDDIQLEKDINQSFINAAIGNIDFRDKNSISSSKNATRGRTKQLPFWQTFLDKLFSLIEN